MRARFEEESFAETEPRKSPLAASLARRARLEHAKRLLCSFRGTQTEAYCGLAV
jgi:hypothetical protein